MFLWARSEDKLKRARASDLENACGCKVGVSVWLEMCETCKCTQPIFGLRKIEN